MSWRGTSSRPCSLPLPKSSSTFGDEVISPEGTLRRDVLARIVFSDPAARQKLEAITHPLIREQWEKACGALASYEAQGGLRGHSIVV